MGKLGTFVLTCVLSLVCGFLGALGAVAVFQDQLQGPQGVTGLAGAPGEQGPPGLDGADGEPGARGKPGRAGRPAQRPTVDLGTAGCAGRSVTVVTDVVVTNQRVRLTKRPVCVTG